jgi:drug/metabolite transporter (DMT)-like permease
MPVQLWHMWIILIGLAGAIAAVLVRGFVYAPSLLALLFTAIFLHVFQVYAYTRALEQNASLPLYAMTNILGILIAIILDWWIFNMKLNTIQIIGLAFGIVAIILMSWTS